MTMTVRDHEGSGGDLPPGHDHGNGGVGHDPAPAPISAGAALGYIPVPNWFSWENQGAGVAISSLERSGQHDVLVLMVDGGERQNQGLYRIGRSLDSEGNVTAGWDNWIDIPDSFSWENQGAGLAPATLAPDGAIWWLS